MKYDLALSQPYKNALLLKIYYSCRFFIFAFDQFISFFVLHFVVDAIVVFNAFTLVSIYGCSG